MLLPPSQAKGQLVGVHVASTAARLRMAGSLEWLGFDALADGGANAGQAFPLLGTLEALCACLHDLGQGRGLDRLLDGGLARTQHAQELHGGVAWETVAVLAVEPGALERFCQISRHRLWRARAG